MMKKERSLRWAGVSIILPLLYSNHFLNLRFVGIIFPTVVFFFENFK